MENLEKPWKTWESHGKPGKAVENLGKPWKTWESRENPGKAFYVSRGSTAPVTSALVTVAAMYRLVAAGRCVEPGSLVSFSFFRALARLHRMRPEAVQLPSHASQSQLRPWRVGVRSQVGGSLLEPFSFFGALAVRWRRKLRMDSRTDRLSCSTYKHRPQGGS